MIRILDEQPHSRAQAKHKVRWRVLVEYRIRRCKVRQEWFAKSYLTTLFGSEQVKQARELMEREAERAQIGSEADGGSSGYSDCIVSVRASARFTDIALAPDVSDAYEEERIKNIEENKELLRSLGLSS